MAQLKIFDKAKITYNELYNSAKNFLQKQYDQVNQVFTNASPFGQLLSVILDLGRLILYYIEDSITELNINTANRANSIYGLSRLTGHNPTRAIAASGNILLTYNNENININGNTVIIPNYTKIKCLDNNLPYLIQLTTDDIRFLLSPNNSIEVNIVQGEYEVQNVTGTGNKLQSYSIFPKRGRYIDNYNVRVYVNSELWKNYDSLLDISYQAKGCIIKTGISGGIDIYFGNGYNGMIPPLGANIRIEYLTTAGVDGNIRYGSDVKFTIEDTGYDMMGNDVDLSKIFNISLVTDISFGTNSEPLYLTKLISPMTSRNFVLANPDNYIYFLEKFNYFSFINAYSNKNDEDITDDNVIYLFLIPDIQKRIKSNENYFSVPQSEFLLKEDEKNMILKMIDESGQKMITTVVKIVDPIFKRYAININLEIFEGYNRDVIRNEIESALSNYFLNNKRVDKIPKSDLIAIIEDIDGVDSINLWFISEENEKNKKINPDADDVGIDEFGDIVCEKGDLVLIRGGWYTRDDIYINDVVDSNKLGSVNINFNKVNKKIRK